MSQNSEHGMHTAALGSVASFKPDKCPRCHNNSHLCNISGSSSCNSSVCDRCHSFCSLHNDSLHSEVLDSGFCNSNVATAESSNRDNNRQGLATDEDRVAGSSSSFDSCSSTSERIIRGTSNNNNYSSTSSNNNTASNRLNVNNTCNRTKSGRISNCGIQSVGTTHHTTLPHPSTTAININTLKPESHSTSQHCATVSCDSLDPGSTLTSLGSVSTLSKTRLEGYDYEFEPPADSKYICPVCMQVLRQAVQTVCGHRFCMACISQWMSESRPVTECPSCKERIAREELFPDNFVNREIRNLSIRCTSSARGCTAILELHQLQTHLDTDCQYVLCPCPNRCSEVILRKDLEQHLRGTCAKRATTCTLCSQEVTSAQLQDHLAVCQQLVVTCPRCSSSLTREALSTHTPFCPMIEVECELAAFGCKHKCYRQQMSDHMTASQSQHILLLADTLLNFKQHLKICPLIIAPSQSPSTIPSHMPPEFVHNGAVSREKCEHSKATACSSRSDWLEGSLPNRDWSIQSSASSSISDWPIQKAPNLLSTSNSKPETCGAITSRCDRTPQSTTFTESNPYWSSPLNTGPKTISLGGLNSLTPSLRGQAGSYLSDHILPSFPFDNTSISVDTISMDSLFLPSESLASVRSDYMSMGSLGSDILDSSPALHLERMCDHSGIVPGARPFSASSSNSSSLTAIVVPSGAKQGEVAWRGSDPGALHLNRDSKRIQPSIGTKLDQQLTSFERRMVRNVSEMERGMTERLATLERSLMSRFCWGDFIWKIPGVHAKRVSRDSAALHSPPFYTSPNGYRFCARVNLNGIESGFNRNIGLFVHIVKGENDDLLDWPFMGKIILSILDQSTINQDRQSDELRSVGMPSMGLTSTTNSLTEENPHFRATENQKGSSTRMFPEQLMDHLGSGRQGRADIVESVATKPGLVAFERPVGSRNHKGFGYKEFASISILDDSRYVKDDTLVIRVVVRPNVSSL